MLGQNPSGFFIPQAPSLSFISNIVTIEQAQESLAAAISFATNLNCKNT